ncbi:hypothetical protein GW750_06730 [bacterium]|nr:hypothetical protein [bacterium]
MIPHWYVGCCIVTRPASIHKPNADHSIFVINHCCEIIAENLCILTGSIRDVVTESSFSELFIISETTLSF